MRPRQTVFLTGLIAALGLAAVQATAHAYPEPSPYPVTWELQLDVKTPKRIVVDGKAYWYVTYVVSNTGNKELTYLPIFEVLTPNGKVSRTDRLIPPPVAQTIRQREGIKFLEQATQIAGEVRVGEDQVRDGVAIWPEASIEDREFTVFASGFSGETAKVDAPNGGKMTLFKNLQLDFAVAGDARFRDINEVRLVRKSYVMR